MADERELRAAFEAGADATEEGRNGEVFKGDWLVDPAYPDDPSMGTFLDWDAWIGRKFADWLNEQAGGKSITCPVCAMTSHHPKDIKYGYCGNCHEFTSPPYGAEVP